ncbi:hypothetical protein D050_4180 [Vibrio parahaemolyticus VPCR-2009]|nr:hypothetical protein D050_4180 [Vibrio parahaemolyticus VPCR-2009]
MIGLNFQLANWPTGQLVTAQQVLIGVALLELGASNDLKVAHQILKYARILKKTV